MRTMATLMMLPTLAAFSSTVSAQSCPPPERPYFDFQVAQPAVYAGDSTLTPRPARLQLSVRNDPAAFLVQFVVDTLGQPLPSTFRVLKSPSAAANDSVRAVLPRWHYKPAVHGGCRVPQLVQTLVAR